MSNGSVYVDGDYTQVQPCSLPVFSAPIPGVNIDYVLRQDFVQYEASYASAPLNTFYPKSDGTGGVSGETWLGFDTYNGSAEVGTGFQLVSEGPREDLGEGVIKWTRTYAKVPATHHQPGQIAYNFIGFADVFVFAVIYRQRFTKTVPSDHQFDYFLLTSSGSNALLDLEQANYIPAQTYLAPHPTLYPLPDTAFYTDYITNTSLPPTEPTLAQYGTWVSSGTVFITAQDSQFERWMGNIIQREIITIRPL